MVDALLTFRGVRAGYGDAVVLDDIDLEVPVQGSLAVLGRNGVGKSTLLLTIMGYTSIKRGTVSFKGQDVTAWQPHRRARAGIGWVAQEREIFPSLTVEENLTVASRPGRWDLKAVHALFPRLAERKNSKGNQLSGGEQQMLALARALMTNPSLLVLDEPMEGLAPIIVEEVARAIQHMMNDDKMAVIIVEQHADLALKMTQQALLLERGKIVHRAVSADLAKDTATLNRYMGLSIARSA
jgi:branched-chain amino acid transport system ATP-binding protein